MNCLVTGGTGFSGTYVCKELLRSGNKVIAYDRLVPNVMHDILTPEEIKEIDIIHGDVADFGTLAKTVNDLKVTHIIHLAGWLHPYCSLEPNIAAIQGNIIGQQNVLEVARLFNLRKVVWASSVVVFGPRERHSLLPVPDDATHHPTTVYAATKSFCEMLAANYHQQWGIDILGLRYTLVYGPGRLRGASAFINNVIVGASLGLPVEVSFADDTINWQYVEDIAHLTAKCIKLEKTKRLVFNTQCDIRPIREGVNYLSSYLRKNYSEDVSITFKPGVFGIAWELDDAGLQEEIGFTPEYQLERGIELTINFTRNNPYAFKNIPR